MSKSITATAIAIFSLAAIGLTAAPASAGGYNHGGYSKTVHITKKVVYQRGGSRWNRSYRRNVRSYRTYKRRHYRSRPVRRVVTRTVYVAPRHAGYNYGYSNRSVAGGLIGAALGAFTGSHIGKGSGRTAAIIGGALIGAIVGNTVAEGMDRTDAVYTARTLETARTGNAVTWTNPDTGNRYSVTPTRTYQTPSGQYCREFTTWGWIGGYEKQLHGTACRQADGSWKNVS